MESSGVHPQGTETPQELFSAIISIIPHGIRKAIKCNTVKPVSLPPYSEAGMTYRASSPSTATQERARGICLN
ncbi:hypothetical protein Nepgr_014764 [Nepenthes gracilis]|uniref:Uncharacterized protein n=1 Tax=Nepenthes gracilis TaxID=150966 RepID=A0AAD3SKL7_NEPGR|nr:hypothetical protein Nepgr_014764 [Nepenthes gracilis]